MSDKRAYTERCEEIALYIIETGATVRAAAEKFGISKSTVHKDVTSVLWYVNRGLCLRVRDILEQNKLERHLRGGEATRRKYLGISELRKISVPNCNLREENNCGE